MSNIDYTTIKDLVPGKNGLNVIAKIYERNEQEITINNKNFTQVSGYLGDQTGIIKFSFLAENAKNFPEGSVVQLLNVNCPVVKSRMILRTHRDSILSLSDTLIESIDKNNDRCSDEYIEKPSSGSSNNNRPNSDRDRKDNNNNKSYREGNNNNNNRDRNNGGNRDNNRDNRNSNRDGNRDNRNNNRDGGRDTRAVNRGGRNDTQDKNQEYEGKANRNNNQQQKEREKRPSQVDQVKQVPATYIKLGSNKGGDAFFTTLKVLSVNTTQREEVQWTVENGVSSSKTEQVTTFTGVAGDDTGVVDFVISAKKGKYEGLITAGSTLDFRNGYLTWERQEETRKKVLRVNEFGKVAKAESDRKVDSVNESNNFSVSVAQVKKNPQGEQNQQEEKKE